MSETTEDTTPDLAWRLVLAGSALSLIVATILAQRVQEATIPPLIVQEVLLAVGLVLLVLHPRLGAITLGVLAVLSLLVNLPFIVGDLVHPESFWSFVPSAIATLAGLVGAIGLVGVLRRSGGGPAGIVGAVAIAAVVGIVAVAGVQSGGQEDDVQQEGDWGVFAQDIEFTPDTITAPAGDIGVFIGNDDLVRHNFSIDELDVDEELPSKAYVRVALADVDPGEYRYYCNIEGHEDMEGTLTVE
jgi:plastocyanin